jgi:hypothetical protein
VKKYRFLALGALLLASTAAVAQSTDGVNGIVNQLLPADAHGADSEASSVVLTIQAATRSELLDRLGFSGVRSLGNPAPAVKLPPLVKGNETELLLAIRALPSVQVAVAFQGASDALAPEANALLGQLGDALADPKLASSHFVVGVYTNSTGSDEYNLDLSTLRAKAIVDALVVLHGISRDRLVPFGFGRVRNGQSQSATSDERIQIVNLGAVAPEVTSDRPLVSEPPKIGTVAASHTTARPFVHPGKAVVAHTHLHRRSSAARVASVGARHWHVLTSSTASPPGPAEPANKSISAESLLVTQPHASGAGGGGGSGGGGGGAGPGGWSDRRLKRNIRRVGATVHDLALYSFQYIWGGPYYVGVMAQEVLEAFPEAVITEPSGYLRVDYEMLGIRMMTLSDWEALVDQ